MDNCVLIKPDVSWTDEIRSYRKEMLDAGSSFDGAALLMRMEDIGEWLDFVHSIEDEATAPRGMCLQTSFYMSALSDEKIVGMIQLRRGLNDYLEKYGGHIGYSVRPNERRKGYAKQMLADCLIFCKEHGLSRVLITCKEENEGSKRTILFNGGAYENTVFCERDGVMLERYWINLRV